MTPLSVEKEYIESVEGNKIKSLKVKRKTVKLLNVEGKL